MKQILLFDNYDSFSYLLADYLKQAGAAVTVIPNDLPYESIMSQSRFDGVVLSPGAEKPEDAGLLMPFIERYAQTLPMLGVCLGHQALGLHFGMRLEKASKPVHGKISTLLHSGKGIFRNLPPEMEVCRYHSLVLKGESPDIEVLAHTPEKEIMAIQHRTLPLTGVQFHPEAVLTQCGLQMIGNWLEGV